MGQTGGRIFFLNVVPFFKVHLSLQLPISRHDDRLFLMHRCNRVYHLLILFKSLILKFIASIYVNKVVVILYTL